MRKIVRNRYRYVRTYERIACSQRQRQGLRLIRLVVALSEVGDSSIDEALSDSGVPLPSLLARVSSVCGAVFVTPEQSLLLQLHARLQAVTINRLANKSLK